MPRCKAHVAVIGAGPAGLAVAQQLLKEGHSVVVFEAGPAVGGAWRFDSSTDTDPLGLDPQRIKVHSSMYESLRTNLPRALMTYIDFPFTPEAMAGRSTDPRMYPLHTEVLGYLHAFADAFDLHRHIQLNTAVLRIDPDVTKSATTTATAAAGNIMGACSVADLTAATAGINTGGGCCSKDCIRQNSQTANGTVFPLATGQELKWRVVTETSNSSSSCSSQHSRNTPSAAQKAAAFEQTGASIAMPTKQGQQHDQVPQQQQQQQQQQEWLFDAVAVCVGIFSEPNLPQVLGMSAWPGQQLHSHNYRSPDAFKGQHVMVVGASFSGEEIARAIASHAQQVYHCARTFTGPGTAREPPATAEHGSSSSRSAAQQPVLSPEQEKLLQQQSSSEQGIQTRHASMTPQEPDSPGQAAAAAAAAVAAAGVPAAPEPRSYNQQQQQQQDVEDEVQRVINHGSVRRQPATAESGVPPAPEPRLNIQRLPMLQQLLPDGAAVLQDGQVLQGVDAIVYCTGYGHTYPWLEHLGIVETSDAHVRPLYQHMFVPAVGPSLAFIGLPWRCAKMPQFQLQGQLLARLLSGRAQLPSQQEMMQEQQCAFEVMAAGGIPRRYTHCMAKFMPQDEWAYADALCSLAAGCRPKFQQQQQQQQQPRGKDDSVTCTYSSELDGVRNAGNSKLAAAAAAAAEVPARACCCSESEQAGTAGSEQQQQQQQDAQCDGLLVMPWWLTALACGVAGDILSRPDTFRDSWSNEVEQLMQQADQEMLRVYNAARS